MGITKDVVARIVKVTFLSWSARNPNFLSFNHQTSGISTQIRLKPLSVNAFRINQQALVRTYLSIRRESSCYLGQIDTFDSKYGHYK